MNFKLVGLFLLCTHILFAAQPKTYTQELPVKELQAQNKKILTLVVEEISKDLPKKIDDYTKLTNIHADGTTLVYTFEINTGSKSDKSVIKDDKKRMQKGVEYGVCRSSKRFLDALINIRYIYKSAKTKSELFSFTVTQQTCLDLK